MKIKELEISGFTCFNENKLKFSDNINVIIGKNGTGKTHILKLLASVLSSNEISEKSPLNSKERLEGIVAEQLIAFFKPEQLGRLVRRQQGRTSSKVKIRIEDRTLEFGFSNNSKSNVKIENSIEFPPLNFLYLPPREMFSLYDGFLYLHEKREISFDETYVRLAKALDAPLLKGRRYEEVAALIKPLEDELNVSVIKENGRFYLKDSTGKMEAHLVAEGLRKLSTLMYLILNGELTKNSILFWDEPESNLNPKLITVVASFLLKLAENGVQIFISTHDYLLTHHLSLTAEYNTNQHTDMKFFCLNKDENNTISIEEGSTLASINNNPILDEFAAFYDLEQSYFNNSLK